MLKGLFRMLNNKGQSLVLFVVVLPILLLIVILVIDVGRLIVCKQELDNINNIALDYGLDNIDVDNLENELRNIILLNKADIDEVNIFVVDNKIYIELNDKIEGLFTGLINVSIFDINSSYVGYIEVDKKKIEKVVGD